MTILLLELSFQPGNLASNAKLSNAPQGLGNGSFVLLHQLDKLQLGVAERHHLLESHFSFGKFVLVSLPLI